jgi:single-strand DNA-binding protein
MINKITIVGRLVDAPTIKWTPNGKAVANFKIASTRSYKDKNTGEKPTDFPMVVVWGNDAEFIANNGKKGAMVALSGRLETRSYDHAQYPIKVYVTEINADEVQLLDWNNEGQGGGQRSQSNNNQGGGSYGGGNYGNNNNQGGYGNGGGYNQGGQRNNNGYGGNGSGYGGNNNGYGGNQGGSYGQSGDLPGSKTIDINDDDLPF